MGWKDRWRNRMFRRRLLLDHGYEGEGGGGVVDVGILGTAAAVADAGKEKREADPRVVADAAAMMLLQPGHRLDS